MSELFQVCFPAMIIIEIGTFNIKFDSDTMVTQFLTGLLANTLIPNIYTVVQELATTLYRR